MKKISHGCTLDCFSCCKFNVYVEDNKIVKLEGDKEHPYTKGIICGKGRAHLSRLTHPDRIEVPLLKINNEWKEISFEEALNIVSEKLKYYSENYTTKSIMYYTQYGSGSVLKDIGDKFFDFLGGVSKSKGGPCWSAGIQAQEYDFGTSKSHSLEDMLNSKNIFIWGKNPAYTNIHHMLMIKKAKEKGIKLIVIDPIHSATAKVSDMYVQINPGSDGALAMAMTKIIINKEMYDTEYIKSYVKGFDEYKEYINTLDLEELILECGIEEPIIDELVRLYTQKYSTIYLGYGMQKYFNGGNNIRAIDALGAITGQIGFSGGGINYANKVYPSVINTDPYESSKYAKNRYFYTSEIAEFIEESLTSDIPIKMAVITKSNLINQLGDLNKLEKAFEKIEFKVCFDMFMTDTAEKCDLFIPCTNTFETEDLLYSSMSNPYIIYNEKAVEPKNKLMDEYYFFTELSKKLNIEEYPKVSKKEYLEKVVEPLKKINRDINLEQIKNSYVTIHKSVPWEDKIFETPSNKFEIYSPKAKENGNEPLPTYIKNQYNKYRLLTNHHKDSIASQHLMEKKGLQHVYINEKMAIKLSVQNEDTVKLVSKQGDIQAKIKTDNSIKDNIMMMYAGWWKKHSSANYITNSGISDMGGQVTYNETFVDIIKQN